MKFCAAVVRSAATLQTCSFCAKIEYWISGRLMMIDSFFPNRNSDDRLTRYKNKYSISSTIIYRAYLIIPCRRRRRWLLMYNRVCGEAKVTPSSSSIICFVRKVTRLTNENFKLLVLDPAVVTLIPAI